MSALPEVVHLLIVSIHSIAAFALVGGIIYMGLTAAPEPRERDVPIRERRFAWAAFAFSGVTGVALIPLAGEGSDFWNSSLGLFLIVKILLFIALLCSTLYLFKVVARGIGAVTAQLHREDVVEDFTRFERFSFSDLKRFSGMRGRRALIAYRGKIYDVTGKPHWLGGMHFREHRAGNDLTEAMKRAPHPDTLLKGSPIVGDYDPDARQSGSATIRELNALSGKFYRTVMFNVAAAAATAVIVALWRR